MSGYSTRRKSSQGLLDGEYHSSSRSIPYMRNWPLFVFLSALVFFFYIFYIYQAASTELSMTKEHLELQYKQQRALKNDIIDVKSELEKAKNSERTLKESLDGANAKYEECSSSLRTIQLRQSSLTDEKKAADETVKERAKEAEDTKLKLSELESKHESLRLLYDTQLKLVDQLNSTIRVLQSDLAAKGVGADAGLAGHAHSENEPTTTTSQAAQPIGGDSSRQQQEPPTAEKTTTASNGSSKRSAADLGDLIKEDKAEEEAEVKKDKEVVENGEKPAPEDKEKEEVKPDGDEKNDMEVAEEKMEEKGDGLEAPAKPGDRVKMEDGLMEADKKKDSEGAELERPKVQGAEYVDKDVDGVDAVASSEKN